MFFDISNKYLLFGSLREYLLKHLKEERKLLETINHGKEFPSRPFTQHTFPGHWLGGGLPGTGEMRAWFQVVGSLVSGALHHPPAAGFTDAMAVLSHNLTVHLAPHPLSLRQRHGLQ